MRSAFFALKLCGVGGRGRSDVFPCQTSRGVSYDMLDVVRVGIGEREQKPVGGRRQDFTQNSFHF